VAAQSKTWVHGRSLARIESSNLAGGHRCLSCECRVLLGSGLYDGPITRPEESYQVWCV